MTKYLFVTGGVVSGLGKGINASSLGRLFKARGLKVFVQKFDPYLNIDPGAMSPDQHGEVYVTEDGVETDLDLGHYERFIDENLNSMSTLTTGMIYSKILSDERQKEYLGQTLQVVPHVTNEIKKHIYEATNKVKPDIQIIEIGGTVGDIESLPFLEAMRQVFLEIGNKNVMVVHTTLLPYLSTSNELKTKPTQHSVKELMGLGIIPNFIVLRADRTIPEQIKEKISKLCTVKKDYVISAPDVDNIYTMPLILHEQKMDTIICKHFGIKSKIDMSEWEKMINNYNNLKGKVNVALVGEYIDLKDAYISIKESLNHAGVSLKSRVNIKWINSESVTKKTLTKTFKDVDAILIPDDIGCGGVLGKMLAIKYARENNIPFLGICLGMQLAIVEYARNVLGLEDADSTQFNENTQNPVIDCLPKDGLNISKKGRIGAYDCIITKGTLTHKLYKKENVKERHRHNCEFNNKFEEMFKKDFVFSGRNPQTNLVEIIEHKKHPYFIASQFHPEFKSRPTKPHPLFYGLVLAAINNKGNVKTKQ